MPYYVYILASKRNGKFYIGDTNNLARRVFERRETEYNNFPQKYNVYMLGYYELIEEVLIAITREKHLKKWNRTWKINLIESTNLTRRDLYFEFDP